MKSFIFSRQDRFFDTHVALKIREVEIRDFEDWNEAKSG